MAMLTAEARKLTSTRTTLLLGLAAAAVVVVGAVTTVPPTPAQDLTGPVHEQSFFLLGSVNLSLFGLLVGVRSSTDEHRHGTISWWLLATRRRSRLVVAKTIVAGLFAGAIAAVAVAAGIAVAVPLAGAQGGALSLTSSDAAAIAGVVAAGVLWGASGVAVGTLIRHQVAAVITVLTWVLALENLGAAAVGDASRFLPGQAAHAMASVEMSAAQLDPIAAGLVLCGYAAVLAVAASTAIVRRPIPSS